MEISDRHNVKARIIENTKMAQGYVVRIWRTDDEIQFNGNSNVSFSIKLRLLLAKPHTQVLNETASRQK